MQLQNGGTTTFSVCGNEEADDLFQFLSDNYTLDSGFPLEWGCATLGNCADESNIIGTSHKAKSISLLSDLTNNGYSISVYSHSQPSGSPYPSGSTDSPGKDIGNASIHEKNHPGIILYVYSSITGYSKYNSKGFQDERLYHSGGNSGWKNK